MTKLTKGEGVFKKQEGQVTILRKKSSGLALREQLNVNCPG